MINTAHDSIYVKEAATGAVVIGQLVLITVIVKLAFVNYLQHWIMLFRYCMKLSVLLC